MIRTKGKYKFIDGEVIPCYDLLEWAEWFEKSLEDRIISKTKINSRVRVSTVFLGLDQYSIWEGPPHVFETMIFGGDDDLYRETYHDVKDAKKRHAEIVIMLRAGISPDDL